MDEAHPCAAFLHVALNPVRARLTARAADRTWANRMAPLSGRPEGVTLLPPLTGRLPDFARRLAVAEAEGAMRPWSGRCADPIPPDVQRETPNQAGTASRPPPGRAGARAKGDPQGERPAGDAVIAVKR